MFQSFCRPIVEKFGRIRHHGDVFVGQRFIEFSDQSRHADRRGIPSECRRLKIAGAQGVVLLLHVRRALRDGVVRAGTEFASNRLDEIGETRLGLPDDRQIGIKGVLLVLDIAARRIIVDSDRDRLRRGIRRPTRRPRHSVGGTIEIAPWVIDAEEQKDVGFRNDRRIGAGEVERMIGADADAGREVEDGRAEQFRELRHIVHVGLTADRALRHDDRILRGHEHLRRFGERLRRGDRRDRRMVRRYRELVAQPGQGVFLQPIVERDEHGPHWRRRREAAGVLHGIGDIGRRYRPIGPFERAGKERRQIRGAMIPGRRPEAFGLVSHIAGEHHDRNAIRPGVVDRHRGVLKAQDAIDKRRHRFACGARVAVAYGDADLLVHDGDQFGLGVFPIMNNRLVQTAYRSPGIDGDIVEIQRLEDVDHEIGTGIGDGDRRRLRSGVGASIFRRGRARRTRGRRDRRRGRSGRRLRFGGRRPRRGRLRRRVPLRRETFDGRDPTGCPVRSFHPPLSLEALAILIR